MKRLPIILIAFLLLVSLSFTACGNGQEDQQTETPKTTQPTEAPKPSQPSTTTSGVTWNDMVTYPGAMQIQKGGWAIPSQEGEWSEFEWRYYESGNNIEEVASYYRSNMPGKGWQEQAWMDMQQVFWLMYTKNNEDDGAYIWGMTEDNKTIIAAWRGTK